MARIGSAYRSCFALATITLLSGCALAAQAALDEFKKTEAAQTVGLVPDEPCVLTRREGRGLVGAYLRGAPDGISLAPLFVTGRPAGLTGGIRLSFDDTTLRRLRADASGNLSGSQGSTAMVRAGFGDEATLPSVYDLSYRASGAVFEGPIVVGRSPASQEIPTSGIRVFDGPVALTLQSFDETGGMQESRARARFRFEINYASGRAAFS
ncbi:MAG: hypothetical protein AAF330_07035, partial [Pseudomonadota bacterium]